MLPDAFGGGGLRKPTLWPVDLQEQDCHGSVGSDEEKYQRRHATRRRLKGFTIYSWN